MPTRNIRGRRHCRTYYFPVRTIKYSLFDNSSNKVDLEKARSDRDLAQDRWTREQQNLAVELKSILAQKKESSIPDRSGQKADCDV